MTTYDEADLERHAQKQGISIADAERYFERQGLTPAGEARPGEVFALVTYEPHEGGRLEGVYTSAQAAQRAAYALEFTPTYAYAHRVQLDAAPARFGPSWKAADEEALDTFCSHCHGDAILRCVSCGGMDCYPGFGPRERQWTDGTILAPCTTCGGPDLPWVLHRWEGCRECGSPSHQVDRF